MFIPCAEKSGLLDAMNAHANAYADAVRKMAESISTTTQGEYFQLRLAVSEKRQSLDIAKQRFQSHCDEHGC